MDRWIVALLVLWPLGVSAQTSPMVPDALKVEFFAMGVDPTSGQPTQTHTIPKSAAKCGVAAQTPPVELMINPTTLSVTDPADATKDCVWTLNQTVTIFALPIGANFAAYATWFQGATQASARSGSSNLFVRRVLSTPIPAPSRVGVR